MHAAAQQPAFARHQTHLLTCTTHYRFPPPWMHRQAPTQLVPLVGQLCELERQVLHSREVVAAAEAVLAADPHPLLHRTVTQFQQLFTCPSLEGVLPAMSRLRGALSGGCGWRGRELPPTERELLRPGGEWDVCYCVELGDASEHPAAGGWGESTLCRGGMRWQPCEGLR